MCSMVSDTDGQDACYSIIIQRARDIFSDPEAFDRFCAMIAPSRRSTCN